MMSDPTLPTPNGKSDLWLLIAHSFRFVHFKSSVLTNIGKEGSWPLPQSLNQFWEVFWSTYTNWTKRSSTRIITKTKSRLRIEGSWTSKAGKTEGKWPWTFPSKWVDITRRCRSSCYDKFLSKRTRLVTFPSWKCQLCVLPDFCYILKHFSRFFNHNDFNGWN